MKLQQLLSYVRKAIDQYDMIQEGDRIAIGISGGKDSLALLYALSHLRRFYPKHFKVEALSVDLGLDNMDFDKIQTLCDELNVPYTVIRTDIKAIIFDERKEASPCSLCAKMRKGSLNEAALAHGCNKIAFGHHKDDVVETLMMSLIYEGRLHTFSPVTYWDRTGLTLIRPMIYLDEVDVIGFQNRYELPVCKGKCPVDGHTKREYIKNHLRTLNLENPGVKNRMFKAIRESNIPGWKLESDK